MENASHLTLQQTFLLTEEKCNRTRGQWPYKPAATRAMRNRHVMLYDIKRPWRSFDLRFEISNLNCPGIRVHIASNGLLGHVSL